MDYDQISEIIAEIKFRYIETETWDHRLCEKLFTLTRQIPLMVCRKRGIPMDEQQDLVQFAYQEIFRNLHRVEDNRAFPRYLYVTSDNLCQRYWRKKYHSAVIAHASDQVIGITTAEIGRQQMKEDMLREDLREAVTALPDIYREVVHMFYYAGLTSKEIAKNLDTSINTITSRLRRGRILLKNLMEEQR